MWESRSDFQGLWERRGILLLDFRGFRRSSIPHVPQVSSSSFRLTAIPRPRWKVCRKVSRKPIATGP